MRPWIFRRPGHVLIVAAVAASIVVHTLWAWVGLWPDWEPKPEAVYMVDLTSYADPPEQAKKTGARGQEQKRPKSGAETREAEAENSAHRTQLSSRAAKIEVEPEKRHTDIDQLLTGLHVRLFPVWEGLQPPGLGQVEVELELSPTGEISSLWVTRLQGDPELGDFITRFIRQTGPFPQAARHTARRVVVGLTFDVTGIQKPETEPGDESSSGR